MKVSIIIPVYNVAPYIGDCLRSVMRQTYAGCMECLLVDDCGEDDSMAVAERMIAGYDGTIQFRILHHERNRGLSAARNTGTQEAVGEYLYYLDSDDEITDDCIEKLMKQAMENPEVEMVQGNACRYPMNGESFIFVKEVAQPLAKTNEEVRRCFYRYGQIYVNVWNKLLKRHVVTSNGILCKEGILFEDNLWLFYLLKYVVKAVFVTDITYYKKKRPQSIMTGTDEKTKGAHLSIVYREIMNNLTPGHEQEECDYYARVIASANVRYVRMVPEYKEVFLLCREKCKQYGSRRSQLILAVSYILGKSTYGTKTLDWLISVRRAMRALSFQGFTNRWFPCGLLSSF